MLRVLAPVAVMAAIFSFSAQSGGGEHAAWEIVLRKLGHVSGYALLTVAWLWALHRLLRWPRLWQVAAALSLAYAASDEWHQSFVEGRTGTPVDVAIDAVGIALVVVLVGRRVEARRTRQRGSKRGSPAPGAARREGAGVPRANR